MKIVKFRFKHGNLFIRYVCIPLHSLQSIIFMCMGFCLYSFVHDVKLMVGINTVGFKY